MSNELTKMPRAVVSIGRDASPTGPQIFWKRASIALRLSKPNFGPVGDASLPVVWRPLARLALGLLLWPSAFCLLPSAFAEPGAKIDETKVAKIYYVDGSGADAADDEKHGTQDSPFLTIKHAVEVALRDKDANVGAKVIIGPGTYRESIDIPAPTHDDTDAALIIEAAEHDQTIIDAADTDGWAIETWKKDGAAWLHPWPFKPIPAPSPAARSRNRERPESAAAPLPHTDLLFYNGAALREVESPAALAPGSFCIVRATDRKNPVATVRVLPPEDGDEPTGTAFAVGMRQIGLRAIARRNLVVRGLLFQHTAAPQQEPAPEGALVFERCSNVLVEDVLSQWNNEVGLVIDGSDTPPWSTGFTLRRVRLIHNSTFGLDLLRLKNVLAEDCEISFNNFRNEWAGTIDSQGPAGLRAQAVHSSTWRRQRAVGNAGRGLCWTGDCTDLLVEDAVVRDNLFSGLLIENSPGPSVVRGCFISGNKTPPGAKLELAQPAAVSIEASPNVTLENNVVAGNAMPQLGVRAVAERTDGANFETGAKTTLRAEHHIYRHNAFWGADAEQVLCELPVTDRTGRGDFASFYATLDSDENCFWNPAFAEAFCITDRGVRRRPNVSFAGWRTFLAALANPGGNGGKIAPETGSLWQDPLFMEPAEGDYRLQAESPLIDWGLPSDEGAVAQ